MAEVQYKSKKGVFHIGGGRFFYAQKPVEVADNELDNLLATYSNDLELVAGKEKEPADSNGDGKQEETPGDPEEPGNENAPYTKTSIRKLTADEQRDLIVEFGGNPEETNNEDERVALILQLQEEKQEESE